MGRTIVPIQISNYADIHMFEAGHLPMEKIRRLTIQAVVDTGATRLILPTGVADQLGLPVTGQCSVRYADHRRATRDMVKDVHVQYGDRGSVVDAVLEPSRTDALLGAIVLETLDLLVDCGTQTLVPREPDRIFAEIE
jgi:predicted aspartyl protease